MAAYTNPVEDDFDGSTLVQQQQLFSQDTTFVYNNNQTEAKEFLQSIQLIKNFEIWKISRWDWNSYKMLPSNINTLNFFFVGNYFSFFQSVNS